MEELDLFFKEMMACLDEKNTEAAFSLLVNHMALMQQYLVFLLNNQIITEAEVETLGNNIIEAVQNKDALLLDDVMRYALFSIYTQLMEAEV